MEQEIEITSADELPFEIDEARWGAFRGAELVCPGLYLMGTRRGDCYVVLKEQARTIFSTEALAYGIEEGGAVFFPSHDGQYGDQVIRYEVGRHLAILGRPTPSYDSPYSQALYGAEEAPKYFGAPVPPIATPHGRMTRHLELDKGIFLLETEQFTQMLAVSYPIWDAELSQTAQDYAEMTEYDRTQGMERSMGHLFFPRAVCAAAIYELLCLNNHTALEQYVVSRSALISAIWKDCPAYAITANMQEQLGMGPGNLLYRLVGALGVDAPELEQPPKDFIPYIVGAEDIEFLQLPDSWRLDRTVVGQAER